MQHRGQESAGIASSDGTRIYLHKGMGLASEVFTARELSGLEGTAAIGHVRYSTFGESTLENAQPVRHYVRDDEVALAFNGNLVRVEPLKRALMARGHAFATASDAEVLLKLFLEGENVGPQARAKEVLAMADGAYCVVVLTRNCLVAFRDPRGFRPLSLGRVGDGWMVASETTSFDLVGGRYEREVAPGEVVVLDAAGAHFSQVGRGERLSQCVFEFIYFSRPDSFVFSRQVHSVRKAMGHKLAEESPVPHADVVVPVPDSGLVAALGFAERLGIPFDMGLVRSHYVGRTFIEPEQRIRNLEVNLKLNPVGDALKDKVVVLVDDSVVRGTTSRKIVEMVRSRGAREVHLRIASPPVRWPCRFGIDTPTREELLASRVADTGAMARLLCADSLEYLSLRGMLEVLGVREGTGDFCVACFSGDYPVEV